VTPPPARPLYLATMPDPVFAFFHAAAPGPIVTAVILCPPWGWDDIASYRARRTWAGQLAAGGHPTLRFDFPGSGDSGGSAEDPGRVDAGAGAVLAAAAWLRAETGCSRVAAIGLGLGGLLAAKAIEEGAAIDDLVLWAVPDRGQSFVRQERAFSQMQTSAYSVSGEPEPDLLPPGWMEAGGFVLSAETIAALWTIDLGTTGTRGLSRALLLDRDGIAIDPRVGEHMGQAGIEVTQGKGNGWEAMCFHPERYKVPVQVIEAVSAWLAAAPAAAAPAAADARGAAGQQSAAPAAAQQFADFEVAGVPVRESALILDLPVGPLFAVLAEPVGMPKTGVSGIFLNAGAVRRIGPNRMWVEAARRWAARGVPTLRVDLGGIGDSNGDGMRFRDVGAFYAPQLGEEVAALVDEVVRRDLGERVVLGGLCADSYLAFHGAARDKRVRAALLMNPRLLVWDTELVARREVRTLTELQKVAGWRRLLRGEVRLSRMQAIMQALAIHLRSALRPNRGHLANAVEELLARLRGNETRVMMAFSDDEPLHDELEHDGFFARLGEWPNLEVRKLPGRDHTFRPIVAQRAVHALLDRELTRVLDRVPANHRDLSAPDS
jgi:alpha/beta superfamily hydrolase